MHPGQILMDLFRVFLCGSGCQNRLCLIFGAWCVRAVGQIEMLGIEFATWSAVRPGGWQLKMLGIEFATWSAVRPGGWADRAAGGYSARTHCKIQ